MTDGCTKAPAYIVVSIDELMPNFVESFYTIFTC